MRPGHMYHCCNTETIVSPKTLLSPVIHLHTELTFICLIKCLLKSLCPKWPMWNRKVCLSELKIHLPSVWLLHLRRHVRQVGSRDRGSNKGTTTLHLSNSYLPNHVMAPAKAAENSQAWFKTQTRVTEDTQYEETKKGMHSNVKSPCF